MSAGILAIGILVGATVENAAAKHGGAIFATEKVLRRAGLPVPQDEDLATLVGTHWDTRARMLQLQAAEIPHGGILLLGDSTVEGFWWNELRVGDQNCVALNAGFAGAGVAEIQMRANSLLAETRPALVVLAVGLNDAWPDANSARWGKQYDALLADLVAHRVSVIAVPILPPEQGHPAGTKSAATVARFNALIRAAAQRHGVVVADERAAIAMTHGPLTVDGIHPTGAFYRALETRMLVPTIASVERARHQRCATTI